MAHDLERGPHPILAVIALDGVDRPHASFAGRRDHSPCANASGRRLGNAVMLLFRDGRDETREALRAGVEECVLGFGGGEEPGDLTAQLVVAAAGGPQPRLTIGGRHIERGIDQRFDPLPALRRHSRLTVSTCRIAMSGFAIDVHRGKRGC